MEKKAHKPTPMRFTPQDKELRKHVKELYECPSDIAAIRLILQTMAREKIVSLPSPKKKRRFYPHS